MVSIEDAEIIIISPELDGQIRKIVINRGPTGPKGDTGATGATGPTGPSGTTALTTKGDLLTRDASTTVRLAVGANGQFLSADSSQSSGLKWIDLQINGGTF